MFANAATLTGTTFISNTAQNGGGGGAIFAETATLTDLTFVSNTSQYNGGGAWFIGTSSSYLITDSIFISNTTTGDGGGATFFSTAILIGTSFISNTANSGGGGASFGGSATLRRHQLHQQHCKRPRRRRIPSTALPRSLNVPFYSNTATTESDNSISRGGGAYFGNSATISAVELTGNKSSGLGGGAYFQGPASVTGTAFTSNTAQSESGYGGGAYFNGTATLNRTTFTWNTATGLHSSEAFLYVGGGGGGAHFRSTATLIDTTFISNTTASDGGGAFFYSTATLANATFISNMAQKGGGLLLRESPFLSRIVNCLFASNTAGTGDALFLLYAYINAPPPIPTLLGTGDALLLLYANEVGGTVDIIHTTIAGSILTTGSAIVVSAGIVNISNTIITSHTVGISQTGSSLVNSDYNLFFNNSTNVAGNVVTGSNSVIGNPAFINPSTDNYRLTSDSNAINAGTNAGVTENFDKKFRPAGGRFDIGAWEFGSVFNTAPTANAGPPQTVLVQSSVTLNGGSSFDPDNHALTFAWTQISGAPVLLSSSTAASPFFTAPASGGPLVFRLIVTDQYGLPSAPSDVTITVNNNAPTAEAGPAQTVQTNAPVALDGLGSFDPDNQAITFAWVQVSGPAVTLSSNTAAKPAFTAPAVTSPATVVFQLVVTDAGGLASAPAQVIISVTPQQVMLPVVVR